MFSEKLKLKLKDRLSIYFGFDFDSKYNPFKFKKNKNIKHIDIDLIIPCIDKDAWILEQCILNAKKYLIANIKEIYIVTNSSQIKVIEVINKLNVNFIDENTIFDFNASDISQKYGIKNGAWFFQQFIKLDNNIGTSEYFFVLDADTILINPMPLHSEGYDIVQYTYNECNSCYHSTYKILFKNNFDKPFSYICHMMLFNRKYLRDMKNEIENNHKKNWIDSLFYAVFEDSNSSRYLSEYEIYGNWVFSNKPIYINYFKNCGLEKKYFFDIDSLEKEYSKRYNSISFHAYLNK